MGGAARKIPGVARWRYPDIMPGFPMQRDDIIFQASGYFSKPPRRRHIQATTQPSSNKCDFSRASTGDCCVWGDTERPYLVLFLSAGLGFTARFVGNEHNKVAIKIVNRHKLESPLDANVINIGYQSKIKVTYTLPISCPFLTFAKGFLTYCQVV